MTSPSPLRQPSAPLRAIIVYKTGKGIVWCFAALVLTLSLIAGWTQGLHTFAENLRQHFVQAWALAAARLLVKVTTRRGIHLVIVGLFLDGLLSLLEGWSLARAKVWGPWLVVFASGSLLPFELVALFRHPTIGHLALFVVNLVVVVYLGRKATRDRAKV